MVSSVTKSVNLPIGKRTIL